MSQPVVAHGSALDTDRIRRARLTDSLRVPPPADDPKRHRDRGQRFTGLPGWSCHGAVRRLSLPGRGTGGSHTIGPLPGRFDRGSFPGDGSTHLSSDPTLTLAQGQGGSSSGEKGTAEGGAADPPPEGKFGRTPGQQSQAQAGAGIENAHHHRQEQWCEQRQQQQTGQGGSEWRWIQAEVAPSGGPVQRLRLPSCRPRTSKILMTRKSTMSSIEPGRWYHAGTGGAMRAPASARVVRFLR